MTRRHRTPAQVVVVDVCELATSQAARIPNPLDSNEHANETNKKLQDHEHQDEHQHQDDHENEHHHHHQHQGDHEHQHEHQHQASSYIRKSKKNIKKIKKTIRLPRQGQRGSEPAKIQDSDSDRVGPGGEDTSARR